LKKQTNQSMATTSHLYELDCRFVARAAVMVARSFHHGKRHRCS
jgi:hypothetical protein